MRLLLLLLVVLNLITQYALWFGKSGWERVRETQARLDSQQETNEALQARNNALLAEVQDLKSGTQAVEERARSELGMFHENEIFVQILPPENPSQRTGP
ncbi:MAG TPA: cell division protein FtsB [Paenalcaligenes sp.]|nr:cell division protein FtsB [Paenalcaligenes sp.]